MIARIRSHLLRSAIRTLWYRLGSCEPSGEHKISWMASHVRHEGLGAEASEYAAHKAEMSGGKG